MKLIILSVLASFLLTTMGICAPADDHATDETHCMAHCTTECCEGLLTDQEIEIPEEACIFLHSEITFTEKFIVFEIDHPPEYLS